MNIQAYMESVGLTSGQIDMIKKIASTSNAVPLVEANIWDQIGDIGEESEFDDSCAINGNEEAQKLVSQLSTATKVSVPELTDDEPACVTYAKFLVECLRSAHKSINRISTLNRVVDLVNALITIEPQLGGDETVTDTDLLKLASTIDAIRDSVYDKINTLSAKAEKKKNAVAPAKESDLPVDMMLGAGFNKVNPNGQDLQNDEAEVGESTWDQLDTEDIDTVDDIDDEFVDDAEGSVEEGNAAYTNEEIAAWYEILWDLATVIEYKKERKQLDKKLEALTDSETSQTDDRAINQLQTMIAALDDPSAEPAYWSIKKMFVTNLSNRIKPTIDSSLPQIKTETDLDNIEKTNAINSMLGKYVAEYGGNFEEMRKDIIDIKKARSGGAMSSMQANNVTEQLRSAFANNAVPQYVKDAIGFGNTESTDSDSLSDQNVMPADASLRVKREMHSADYDNAEKEDKENLDAFAAALGEAHPENLKRAGEQASVIGKRVLARTRNRMPKKVLAEGIYTDDDDEENSIDIFDDDMSEAVDDYLFNRKHERVTVDEDTGLGADQTVDVDNLADPDMDPTSVDAQNLVNDYASKHSKSFDREDVNNCDAFAAMCGQDATKSQPWSNRAKDIAKRSLAKLRSMNKDKVLAESDEGDELDAITSSGSSRDYLTKLVKEAVRKAQVQQIERKHDNELASVLGDRGEGGYMNYRDRLKNRILGR